MNKISMQSPQQGPNSAPRAQAEAQHHRGIKARLKIASLNIKGRRSGNIKKWMHIPQIMRERKLGVLAIQETHLTDELTQQFEEMFGNNLSLRFLPDPETQNAKGIAVVLNKRLIKTGNIQETEIVPGRAITLNIPWYNDQDIKILAVYAPNAPREIRDFWKSIQNKINTNPSLKPNVVLGDFNLVEDAINRIPNKPDDFQTTETLREFKIRHKLVDGWRKANLKEKGYTWARDSDGTQSRIDRIYVHEDYFNECSRWDISPAPIPTDHKMVSVSVATPSSPLLGRGRWAIPPRLIKNRRMKAEIQKQAIQLQRKIENMGEHTPLNNPQTMLKKFKTELKETLRKHKKIMQPILKNKIDKLTDTLRNTTNDTSLSEEEIKITTIHIKKEIQVLYQDMHDKNRTTLAAIDAAEGEKIGKIWSARHKESKPRDTIKQLLDPVTNEMTRNSKEMAQIAAEHYEHIQHNDHDPHTPPEEQSLNEILNLIKSKVTENTKRALTKQITEEEVRDTINKTTSEKVPGPNRIPIDLWKSLDDQFRSAENSMNTHPKCDIVWTLTQVFLDVETHRVVEKTKFHEGCICPIYKKKDPSDAVNYRPITLLNMDYKIFTKALSI